MKLCGESEFQIKLDKHTIDIYIIDDIYIYIIDDTYIYIIYIIYIYIIQVYGVWCMYGMVRYGQSNL